MRQQTGLQSAQSKPVRQISALDIYDEKTKPPPSSTRRYVGSAARQTDSNPQVIRRGNQQLVIHRVRRADQRLVFAGLGAIATIVVILAITFIVQAWSNWQTDHKYGYPRTYQIDAVVGHNDGPDRKTHFIFLNLDAQIQIIEIPGGDGSHARMYVGPKLTGDNADKIPVTAEFSDQTGRGTVDMVLLIDGQRTVFLNDGTKFEQEGT